MAIETPTQSVASAAASLLSQGVPSHPAGYSSQGRDSMREPVRDSVRGSATASDPGAATLPNRGFAVAELATRADPRERNPEPDRDPDEERHGNALRLTPPLERLPVELAVAVPVRDFRVRQLLAMQVGELIETLWSNGEDLPLSSGDVQLAWSEFEVVDTRLAVRVTRLA